jgi:hypothetical protein
MLSTHGVRFVMFLIEFLLFVAAFAVMQIALETKGLAPRGHCAVDAVKGQERLNGGKVGHECGGISQR